MSDMSVWQQRGLQEDYGIRTAAAAASGPQEATIVWVGTSSISIDGGPAELLPCVRFYLPNTIGEGPGYGPAPYQPVPGWTPSVNDSCVVIFVGNGFGRPYVVEFPTATPLTSSIAVNGSVRLNSPFGATLSSGSGAPTIAGAKGDRYYRTDTPTVANQREYICTVAGVAGSATWVGIL
jgi:hypothetical protein